MSRVSRASDNLFSLAATPAGLPQTDKEWDDFFRANDWRGSEHVDDEHPTAGNYGAKPGEDPESQMQREKDRASLFPRPSRDLTDRDQTVCHDCAAYMANGEGDPEHEHRFENGMRELQSAGIHPGYNLTLNDQDEEGNRIPPSDNKCLVCGQRVDPEMDNFYGDRGEGTIGVRAHLFQPGDPGYHEPGR
jgi:hypothetical protein